MTSTPPQGVIEILAWLGLLVTGVWTAYKTHRNDVNLNTVKRTAREARDEIKNNHGSSKGDAIDRIESKVDEIANRLVHVENDMSRHTIILQRNSESVKSLGHQIGEIRADANTAHDMIAQQTTDHAKRLRSLENK